jgi:hypothetical protein
MSQIIFPNSPSDGEEFLASNGTTYQYDSDTGQWRILAGPGAQGPPGSSASIPTGMVMPFVGSAAPTEWLECNGSAIPAEYTDLIALVGANTPDLRGEFIRGWDNGKGTDSGRALLSTQTDEFKSHNHSYTKGGGSSGNMVSGGPSPINDGNSSQTTGSRGSSETRPRNIALMYCVKT